MDPIALLLLVVLGVALGASLVFDLAERRIPDLVTLPAYVAALALRLAGDGPDALVAGLAGAALALAPFLLTCAVGGLGMGDVKLMAVVGAVLGVRGAAAAVLLVAAAGAVQGLVASVRAGALVHALHRTLSMLLRRPAPGARPQVTVPYGVSICAGAVLAALLRAG